MLIQEKINIKNLTGDFKIKIPLCQQNAPADKEFYVNEKFVKIECQNSINPIIDNEKFRYVPSVPRIKYTYKKNIATNFVYQDLGFTNDDITFRRNSFINSFLRLQFFDSNIVSNRRLVFEIILFTQLGKDQLDSDMNPLPVNQMPVSFSSYDPAQFTSIIYNSEGYFQHVRNGTENLYMYAFYSNAKDGSITPIISKDEPILFNRLNDFNWVKYNYQNNIYNIDSTDREIQTNVNLTEICLFDIIFI